jgi:hypothetical protein
MEKDMVKMKEKTLTLLTLIFIAMSITGFTYAHWGNTITISGIAEIGALNMGFVGVPTCTEYHIDPANGELVEGEYLGKDVGECKCDYTDSKTDPDTGKSAYNTTIISITNAYPSYIVNCTLTLENIGTIPLNITAITISDPTITLTWNSTENALVDDEGNPVIGIIIIPEDLVGTILEPDNTNNKVDFGVQIHIEQAAKQCQVYQFQIHIAYEEVP